MSQPEAITTLVDAEPAPWQAEKKPDPTPAESLLKLAAVRHAKAKEAIEGFVGGRNGPEHAAVAAEWLAAGRDLTAAALAYAKEQNR